MGGMHMGHVELRGRRFQILLRVVAVAGGLVGFSGGADAMDFLLHASTETPFLGNPFNVKIRHTWSEAYSAAYRTNSTQSWMSGVGRCDSRNGINGCSWAYRSIAYSKHASNNETPAQVIAAFNKHIPGTYLWNGVCHQATNRALRNHTPMKRVVDYGVLSSSLSQKYYGTCGKWDGPHGWFGMSCPN